MKTRIKVNIIKLFLVVCVFLFSNLNALAFNALSGVDVKQINNDVYNITLKVDNSVKIKKVTDSKGNLTLILSSIIPADSIEIVYDNTSDLKNVIVQKKNDQNTIILFQGKNIENAKIYTKELSTGLLKSLDANPGALNNYLYIANKKYFSFAILGFISLFFIMLSLRPKSKRYNPQAQNTIRTKVNSKNRYIPSINYKINNTKGNMSVPKDFVISKIRTYQEQKIRKAG